MVNTEDNFSSNVDKLMIRATELERLSITNNISVSMWYMNYIWIFSIWNGDSFVLTVLYSFLWVSIEPSFFLYLLALYYICKFSCSFIYIYRSLFLKLE